MLTIAFLFSAVFIYYILKLVLKKKDTESNTYKSMEQHEQEVRCSSSESDNFEKIDSDDIKPNGDPHFVVGDEEVHEDEGPAHEGRDSFPNAPPPNLKPKLTVAQQLALAEKRSKLKSVQDYKEDCLEWYRFY